MNEKKEIETEQTYSTWTHLSFNLVMVMLPATYGMLATHLFWFYEVEVLLPVLLVGLAYILFGIWDAFNDPLVGYISDKPNRLTKHFGRRFPWIILFGIPTMLSLILLFSPPMTDAKVNPWPIFIWFMALLIIHEFSYTAVSLARALYPEKFRTDAERRKNAAIGIFTYNFGFLLGFIIPMFIVIEGDLNSYWISAAILMIPCFIFFLLGIPGIRENEEMIQRALNTGREPFFKTLKIALKRKNFVALALTSIAIQVIGACIMASIYYYVKFILLLPLESQADILIIVSWFLAGLISVPIWMKIMGRLGNRKTQIIGMLSTVIAVIPALIVRNLNGAIIAVAIIGFAMGSTTLVRFPIFADLIDEVSLLDGKRQEGVYQGVFVFLDRLGIILQPIIFTVVHIITRFNPEAETQSLLAQQGILAAMLWIPALIMLITCLIFWKVYDITPEKATNNKEKLKVINL
ncbi:MAG: MFS transporter [Promethearchaeota archaeon]|nr:MAG: MFS transporter [Candidatus Lokiarchaeota archaeon]